MEIRKRLPNQMTMGLTKFKTQKMEKVFNWLFGHTPNFVSGAFIAASTYFAPIKGIVTITMLTITIDLILGVWAARVKGLGIKSEKLWRTVYKMLIAFTIMHLLYSIDVEYGVEVVHSYRVAGLFIIGFEIWSVLENAAVITDHKMFRILKRYMENKVKDATGVNLTEDSTNDESNSVK